MENSHFFTELVGFVDSALGAFALWSWGAFQIHCLKLAREYQKAKIEHGHEPVDFVTAFWRMKGTYQSYRISEVHMTFEKPKDEDVK